MSAGVEAGKKAAGEVLALQKRVLVVLNEARYAYNVFAREHIDVGFQLVVSFSNVEP